MSGIFLLVSVLSGTVYGYYPFPRALLVYCVVCDGVVEYLMISVAGGYFGGIMKQSCILIVVVVT